MRSATPKHLHPLLGRRMVDWVLAAVEPLGASPLVVVTSPETADAFGDAGSASIAVQHEPRGTGDAVASARAALGNGEGDVLVLSGDTPLITEELLRELVDGHRSDDADVTVLSFVLDEPGAYGRIVRDDSGGLAAHHRGAGRLARGAGAHRGEQLPLRLLGRRLVGGARPDRSAQRAGRALSHGLCPSHRRGGRPRPRGRRAEPDRRARRQYACRAGAGRCRAQGSHQRAAHACRRDDRRPSLDVDRGRRRARGRCDRSPVHGDPWGRDRRVGASRSALSRTFAPARRPTRRRRSGRSSR